MPKLTQLPELLCPNCNIAISSSIQRKMAPFLGGLPSIPCEGCQIPLQWHHSIRRKMLIWGSVYKIGVIALIISVIAFFASGHVLSIIGIATSLLFTFVGILASATKPDQIKVEIARETEQRFGADTQTEERSLGN